MENKWYEYDNLMSWDKDDLATTMIDLVHTLKRIRQEAKIDNMEITQFKVEPASNNMSIGPNICSFYLKSYKSYANLDPYYYATAHDNGSTSLSLIKGGHIQTRTVENKSYTNEHIKSLIDNGIYCRKYYCPLTSTKMTEYVYKHILCLPCNIDIDLNSYNNVTTYL